MPEHKAKTVKTGRANFYIKPVDQELFEWAKNQRQSLSELIALALMDYRKNIKGKESKS